MLHDITKALAQEQACANALTEASRADGATSAPPPAAVEGDAANDGVPEKSADAANYIARLVSSYAQLCPQASDRALRRGKRFGAPGEDAYAGINFKGRTNC